MYAPSRDRTLPALASLAIVATIASGLIFGLRPGWSPAPAQSLPAFALTPERPPEPAPPPSRHPAKSQAASPAAPRNSGAAAPPPATPPPPLITLPVPQVIVPQPSAGDGASPSLAARAGTGSGASGNGPGGGGSGGGGSGGSGTGSGAGPATPAEQISGHLSPRDLPAGALPPGGQLSVGVSYTVGIDGRLSDCAITRSSGDGEVDSLVCHLLTDRFRYRPARDRRGAPVASTIRESHSWARKPDSRQSVDDGYFPCQFGLRFSANAIAPSRASAEANTLAM